MSKPKMPWWKFLTWGFLVSWEDSGWRLLWFTFTVLTAMLAFDAIVAISLSEGRAAVQVLTIAAGCATLAWIAARLHRRANDESVLEFYKVWKWRKRGKKP